VDLHEDEEEVGLFSRGLLYSGCLLSMLKSRMTHWVIVVSLKRCFNKKQKKDMPSEVHASVRRPLTFKCRLCKVPKKTIILTIYVNAMFLSTVVEVKP